MSYHDRRSDRDRDRDRDHRRDDRDRRDDRRRSPERRDERRRSPERDRDRGGRTERPAERQKYPDGATRRPEPRGRGNERGAPDQPAETPEEQFERDKRTVFVYRIHPQVTPQMLEEFFNKAGKVRAVRLIEDKRSGRSKGMAYIEFFDPNSIIGAMALQGIELMGHPIQVKGSDSQKNFDYVQVQKAKEQTQAAPNNASAKIYIGELHPKLLRDELESFFTEVGPLVSCELSKDPVTGENPGYGYVTYQKSDDAKRALAQLHGFEMLGRRLQIGIVSDAGPEEASNPNSLSAKGKAALMSKLATGQQQPIHLQVPTQATSSASSTSNCVAMRNMFDASQQYGQDFQQDIVEDVAEECQSFGTVVHIAADMQEGAVYLKFASEESAIKAQASLNKRAFNKRTITVEFIPPQEYFRRFNE